MNQDRYSLIDNTAHSSIVQESGYESTEPSNDRPAKFRQYLAAFSATLSALAAGTVLAWTSPILNDLEAGKYNNIKLDSNQIGWIGSFVTFGGMAMCIPTGFICDIIGRKKTLLLLCVPYTIGWLLIIFANNVLMLYFGRLITGTAAGACCIAAPLYTSEIAHKTLRGTLSSYFQLMVTVGIFLGYLLGKYLNALYFTIWCACVPFVFVVFFVFQPESPVYLLKRGLFNDAKGVLTILRGSEYKVDEELNEIEGYLKESSQTTISLTETFKQGSVIKAFIISASLMFFQQFSGVNAVILYTTDIFKTSGVHLDPKSASVMVGLFQVLATFAASLVIDKLGRRILLFISALFVTVNLFLLAIFFTLKDRTDISDNIIEKLGFIPVGALCLFIIAYSLGLGPIPWVISSEIFPTEIKSVTSSTAGTVNWFLAFILTRFYLQISNYIGQDSTFYIFGSASMIGIFFVYIFVPETKGKNILEIQAALNNNQ
ncbi:facilitated trehalose transporter Tret1-2 homolog [Diabrotica virgifera virgifera]|uniref:Major facilitator superfamily (MFS) profile domain-containing protein n=1 Tax=Diabrotica virgifera virgifera TaxID=50390 RepID=A0ABM5IVJ9_DIAVI|nr:facilitated trehalose transporter Tret1-2 homolog [Diabrotica virgifera virgifera]